MHTTGLCPTGRALAGALFPVSGIGKAPVSAASRPDSSTS